MRTRLYVRGFSSDVGAQDLRALFSECGNVEAVTLKPRGRSIWDEGEAIVVMEDEEGALKALRHLDGYR